MHQIVFSRRFGSSPRGLIALLVAIMPLCGGVVLVAQDQAAPTPNVNAQEPPPAAGGPETDVGPYAIPKKKDEPRQEDNQNRKKSKPAKNRKARKPESSQPQVFSLGS